MRIKNFPYIGLLCALTGIAQAQITIDGGNVNLGGAYGNIGVNNGVVTTDGPNGRITAGNGGVSMDGANGPITVRPNQQGNVAAGQSNRGRYQRQGDVTINESQNGQTAIATGQNQRVTNSAGNVAENRSGNYRQGNRVQGPQNENDEAFWGKGGFWGDGQ